MADSMLATCSFRAYKHSMGQAVVTSLQLPKWRDDAAEMPVCHLLTPRWSYFRAPDEEFDREYRAQLQRFGRHKVIGALCKIAEQTGARRLVLLCHEADPGQCHRSLAAEWLAQHIGEQVPELDQEPPDGPHKPGWRLTDDGTQIVQVGKYSYLWDGEEPLRKGDYVELPRGWRSHITGFGSSYAGDLARVVRLIERNV